MNCEDKNRSSVCMRRSIFKKKSHTQNNLAGRDTPQRQPLVNAERKMDTLGFGYDHKSTGSPFFEMTCD